MTPEQLQYVQGELAKGVASETLKQTLRSSGYNEALITQLFNAAASGVPPTAVVSPQAQGPSVLKIVLIVIGVLIGLFFLFMLVVGLVVSSSLNSARDKGEDAATKSTLSVARTEAELYWESNSNSYLGFCDSDSFPASRIEGITFECEDSTTEYRITAELNTEDYFCVDSEGRAEVVDVSMHRPDSLSCL